MQLRESDRDVSYRVTRVRAERLASHAEVNTSKTKATELPHMQYVCRGIILYSCHVYNTFFLDIDTWANSRTTYPKSGC